MKLNFWVFLKYSFSINSIKIRNTLTGSIIQSCLKLHQGFKGKCSIAFLEVKLLEFPWALMFIAKILGSVAVLDVVVFPILWILRVSLLQAYFMITCVEGLCIILFGGLLLITSFFSTVEQSNHMYVGDRVIRYGMRSRKLKKEEKYALRQKGILTVIAGILLFLPTLVILGS